MHLSSNISIDAATLALVVVPVLILQYGLMVYALYDLFQEDRRVTGNNKLVWALIIGLVNLIGPLLYFFVGRDDSRGVDKAQSTPAAPTESIARILATWPALPDTADAAVVTTGLTKRYGGGVVALESLDLTVPSGSIFGFLGPNGAGKTTTLRLLTGLATATGGTGSVAGIKIGGTGGDLARNIGYLDQDPRFYGWMRGRELLNMVGELHGLHGAGLKRRVGEVLEIVGLTDAASRRIGGYSGGMRQRLGIGQALINQPRVLFLDEPVSSLDPEGRRDVLEIISRLRGTATVFMSTHILNDVERVCDRVAILNLGHLVVEGPIDELLDTYAQPVYELEPEPQQPGAVERLAAAMKGQPWAGEIRVLPDMVRVFVNDPKVAGPAILPLVVASKVNLVRYERARPSLEDVFLRLVADKGPAIAPTVTIPVTGLDGEGSAMMGFRVLLIKEMREQLRTNRLIAVAVVFVLFGVLGPLTDRYMKEIFDAVGSQGGGMTFQVPAPSLDGAATQILKNLSQFGIICALLLGMGSVAWEKERGTAGMILTKPASRAAFLAAKLVAISLTLGFAVTLGCGLAYVYTLLLYPTVFPLGGYVAMSLLMWWMCVAFAAITLLGSTLTKSAIAAAGIGLLAMLAFGIVGALPIVGDFALSSLGKPALDLMLGKDPGQCLGPVAFNVALVPVVFFVTWLSFRRQEL